jgi:GAF domain-containing protein
VYIVTLLVMVSMLFYAVSVPEWEMADGRTGLTMIEAAFDEPASPPGIVFFSLMALSFLTLYVNRLGMALVARWAPVALWLTTGVAFIAFTADSPGDPGGAIVALMIIGTLLAEWRGLVVSLVASILVLILRSGTAPTYLDNPVGPSLYPIIIQSIGSALLIYVFLRFARVLREEGASEAVEDREVAAEIVTNIARQVARRVSLNELFNEIVDVINHRYDDIYHTQVFLVNDAGTQAQLVASTGHAGKLLLARSHALAVGSRSVIGQVTLSGQHVIARVGVDDQIHRQNELLPETQVEAAFPLRVGDQIIGALDVQSKSTNAFKDAQFARMFQALADSISLAIDNIGQYERVQAQLRENELLVQETQAALRQVNQLNEQLSGQAWAKYLSEYKDGLGFSVDFERNEVTPNAEPTSTLKDAMLINQFVQEQKDGQQVIAMPLRIAGRVIGAMEFELDSDDKFTPEDLDLIQEVCERFSYAVENSRLFDESQRIALREYMISQVSGRIQDTTDMTVILTEAARGLREMLGAERIAIRLGSHDTAQNGS